MSNEVYGSPPSSASTRRGRRIPIRRHRASDERLVSGRPIRHGRLPDGRRSPADHGSRRPGGRLPKLWMAMTTGAAIALGGTLVQSPMTLTGTAELVSNGGFESGRAGTPRSSRCTRSRRVAPPTTP